MAKILFAVFLTIGISGCVLDFSPNATNTGFCGPLGRPNGKLITLDKNQVYDLYYYISVAEPDDTILLKDGVYNITGDGLWFDTRGVTLRSKSGNPDRVILEASYETDVLISIAASDITIAEITLRRPRGHGIHIATSESASGDLSNVLIYRVNIVDPQQQAIRINPHEAELFFPTKGTIACSKLIVSDEGRPFVDSTHRPCNTGGIDAVRSFDWVVRNNYIDGFWCGNGLPNHAIYFSKGSRDVTIQQHLPQCCITVCHPRGCSRGSSRRTVDSRTKWHGTVNVRYPEGAAKTLRE